MKKLKSISKPVRELAGVLRVFNRKRKEKDLPPAPAAISPGDIEELAEAKPMEVKLVEMEPIEVIPKSSLANLPADVLLEISSRLPPVPRMCLALTCKGFLEIIDNTQSLRQSSHFRLPRTGPTPFTLHRSPVLSPRWELLRNLENARWRFCRDCTTLHPPEEFPDLGEVAGEDGGRCGLGLSKGYVDLCPCRRFTCHDLLRVFKKLEQPGVSTCYHRCSYQYQSVVIEAYITATRRDRSSILIETQYNIPRARILASLRNVPRFCCPHRSIFQHLLDLRAVTHWAPLAAMAEDYKTYTSCDICSARVEDVVWDAPMDLAAGSQCSLRTRRVLKIGTLSADNKYVPDDMWTRQCLPVEGWEETGRPQHPVNSALNNTAWIPWIPTTNAAARTEAGRVLFSTPGLQH